jgi:phenylacetate-CoA ligase
MKYKFMEFGLKTQGRDVFKIYRELLKNQYNSREENEIKQKEKLSKLLLHSYQYVPYYRKILERQNVIRKGKVDLDNFNKLPILTKDLIRKNFDRLVSNDPDFDSRKPFLNTSGGSTGEPVKFYQDNKFWTNMMAVKWLYYSFITDYPCKLLKLWGDERDIFKGSVGFKTQLQNIIANRVLLNSFKMTERDMCDYVKRINTFKPKIIEAYVQSGYEFAKFIEARGLEVYKPKGVLTSAGTLYPEIQGKLEKVFGCSVYNRYGSREVGDIACSCSESNVLHVNNVSLYVEFLDDDFQEIKPGKIGKVYVTTLENFSMPLIRYEIGDIAILSGKKKCLCGRGSQLIDTVKGRYMGIFKTNEGDRIDGEYFVHLFYMRDWLKQFQVIQEEYDRITVKVVLNTKVELNHSELLEIEKKIKLVMGDNCRIKWEYLKKIEPLNNGKYLYTINKMS